MLRITWATRAAISVRHVLEAINGDRSRPVAYTTVQSTMARLTRKGVLARTRCGRSHRYQPEASDAAGIAIRVLLPIFGKEALRRAVAQI